MSINITVAVPAYNRANELKELIDSIVPQLNQNLHELLIVEDDSPQRNQIREIVEGYSFPIRYLENEKNLGYDGNLRKLIREAKGCYTLFMGNDDLLAPGAIEYYQKIISENTEKSLGFIVRAYSEFNHYNNKIGRTIRFVNKDILLAPTESNAAFVFRRSVAIMGMFYKTDLAKDLDTSKYDGSIYYQLWLSGNIALKHTVYVASKVTALRRCGMKADFGNALVEKKSVGDNYWSSISFSNYVENMLSIAKDVSKENQAALFYELVQRDFSAYSYPFLERL